MKKMDLKTIWYKGINKIRYIIYNRNSSMKPKFRLYPSYLHSLIFKNNGAVDTTDLYFTATPNCGAGIGHQMANWIAGYYFAKYFNVNYAHSPFKSSPLPDNTSKWEDFLGFGANEPLATDLLKKGYKKVRLPIFTETDEELSVIKNIISSYSGKRVVFYCEQDQFYKAQYGVRDEIQEKFYSAPVRKSESLIYDNNNFNLAVHIRRGDIVQNAGEKENENLTIRYQSADYFYNATKNALEYLKDKENIHIYIFSQGNENEFEEFKSFNNVHFCLDMSAMDSFLHMVYADALITSKSSFSYKPALINRGIKFSPEKFWHGYPDEDSWILLDENGNLKD